MRLLAAAFTTRARNNPVRARTRPVGYGPTGKECRRHGRIDLRGRWMSVARLTTEAGLAALEGRVDELAESYRAAIEAWRALDCTLDLAMCELDLVLLLGPDVPDATAAKGARDIFTQIGTTPFLERLDNSADTRETP